MKGRFLHDFMEGKSPKLGKMMTFLLGLGFDYKLGN